MDKSAPDIATILLTGGCGFIGSNLADKLLDQGHRVINLDNLDPFYSSDIKLKNIDRAQQYDHYEFIEGDILDDGLLDQIFSKHDIELVIHLAAKAGVRNSLMHPVAYYQTNVTGTLRILEKMRTHGVRKMVLASSSSVYGNNEKLPFSEEDFVDHPVSPYAATKKATELMAYHYCHLYDFDITCLRFFTVYGRRQRPEMAIANFTNKIIAKQAITVYGDGSSSRDYTYIDDILQGIISSMVHLRGFEVINLGESQTTTLHQLIQLIESNLGQKAVIHRLPMQPGDVMATYADITKAKRVLGYEPTTLIEDGIKKYTDWVKTH